MTLALYTLAAVLELAGCFAVWAWWRGASALWLVPGGLALAGFALALAMTAPALAGRSFAAYGGVYIAASLGWMWAVEGEWPSRADVLGTALALVGTGIILWGQKG